ncbi:Required for respiratory growth protein 9, mitochondrial [Cyberlindnera fabianii]|uniref:Required for respiratory growth protein 9, mitochondrial n=1 Tax=Cyberlindnera fabianii TaxID=36022 RepID=A0A1V2L917_CYBFA|nr:Required for respiratory growth protein 9, mitochondrial [Cyberlindnera fabianii]
MLRLSPVVAFTRHAVQVWPASRRWFTRSSIVKQHNFTSSNISIVEDSTSKPKKKRHSPRTLESLASEATPSEYSEPPSSSPSTQDKTKRTDPISAVNTGTYVPPNWRKQNLPEWKRQKFALAEKFKGQKWDPNKKLSRESMQSVRILKAKLPELTASELAQHFQVAPEAIRRILKSKWQPNTEEEEDKVMERWKRRKERVKAVMKDKKKKEKNGPVVVLNSGKDYTEVKPEWELKKKQIKIDGKRNRMFKAEKNNLRKMEF